MINTPFFRKYLLPGFVYQSLVIGGGYGTGREIVEFFMNDGPVGGYLGMAVATAIWSLVMAIGFELARMFKVYDYRTFLKRLLGPAWIGYEFVYVAGMILVTSVLGSAAGEIVSEMVGIPSIVGIIAMIVAVGFFAYFGTALIERFLSIWSFALYAVFIVLIVTAFVLLGDVISANAFETHAGANWALSGARYAAYNVGLLPAMLFALRHVETRREAFTAGTVAGLIAMLPGLMIYVAMLGRYPQILSVPIPADFLLAGMNVPALRLAFQIILFGTLIETGLGMIHGFNERIAGVYEEHGRPMPRGLRMGLGVAILVTAIFVADAVGIVDLIATGYGALTIGYWVVFVIPVLTIGVWRVFRVSSS